MAQGDLTLFEEFTLEYGQKIHDFTNDTFKFALVSDASVAASLATPRLADFTQVSGTNYTAGGETLTIVHSEAAGVTTVDSTANPSWTQHASGPTGITFGVIYNSTDASDRAIAFVDMRASGPTAISLVDGDISFTFHASGIFTNTAA